MIVLFMLLFAALPGNAAAQTLDELLARMDQNAMSFKSMSAKLRYMSYVAVIKEGTVSTGTLTMKRSRREAMVLVDFTEPDPKTGRSQQHSRPTPFPRKGFAEIAQLSEHGLRRP